MGPLFSSQEAPMPPHHPECGQDEETLDQVAQPPFPGEQQKEQDPSIGHGFMFSQVGLMWFVKARQISTKWIRIRNKQDIKSA